MAERFGKYEIEAEVGAGAFGTVFRARDTSLGRLVALKVLAPLLMRDKRWVEQFHREAHAMARLDHPNIVTVHEVAEHDGRLYIAMQYVDGPNLGQRLKEGGPLSWEETLQVTRDIAAGLDHAHERGVLHRDLKPENVLLGRDSAMLTDFGFAALAGESRASISLSRGAVGSPPYIAPEIWDGANPTRAADTYALGCILSEMLTGEKLYKGERPSAVMRAHFKPPELPEEWPAGVPEGLDALLNRALAQETERRFSSAGDLAKSLGALEVGVSPVPLPLLETEDGDESVDDDAMPLVEPDPSPLPDSSRLRLPLLGTSALVVLLLILWGAWELFGGRDKGRISESTVIAQLPAESTRYANTTAILPTSEGTGETLTYAPTDVDLPTVAPTFTPSPDVPSSTPSPTSTQKPTATPTPNLTIGQDSAGSIVEMQRLEREGNYEVALSPDGQTLAVASSLGVYLYDIETLALQHFLDAGALTGAVAFSPDGQTLASGSDNAALRLWRASDGALLASLWHPSKVLSVAFSPDGQTVASGADDRTVRLWSASDGLLLDVLAGQTSWVNSVAFSPDGQIIASTSSDGIRLWRTSDGAPIDALAGQRGNFSTVAFSPDGQTVATASDDSTVLLWGVSDNSLLSILEGHTDGVNSVAFSPDGQTVATGSNDDTIRLWSASDGTLFDTLEGHTNAVWTIAFSPDGETLVSGSFDDTVRIWGVNSNGDVGAGTNSLTPTLSTETLVPGVNSSTPLTSTSVPLTGTPVPPTNTRVPPTNTPLPPTNTPALPTSTPVPPTHTPLPPPTLTDTPEPLRPPGAPSNASIRFYEYWDGMNLWVMGDFTWSDNSDNEDGFNINGWIRGANVTSMNAAVIRKCQSSPENWTESFSVFAFNAAGNSGSSSTTNSTTIPVCPATATPAPPGAPTPTQIPFATPTPDI